MSADCALPMATLGDIVRHCTEKAVGQKKREWPYVGLEHMESRSPDLLGTAHSSASTSTNNVFHPGDVLFGKLRPYLRKSVAAEFSGYCSTDILVLRPNDGVVPTFAAKVLQAEPVFARAVATSIGTKMPRTSWAALKVMELFCPHAPEQRRIAEILDTLDEAIRRTEQVIAKLQQMKQGLLHDLLTRGIAENGELRNPESQPEKFKDSEIGQIPRTWEVVTLGDLVRRVGGLIQTGPFGSQLHAYEYVEDGVPVVMPQDIQGESINLANIARITERKATQLARHRVQANDTVFARRGDLSRCLAIGSDEEGWLCGTGCLLVRVPETSLSADWLTAVYRHDWGQRQILARAVGSTMVNLNGQILSNLSIPLPPVTEQTRFAERSRAIRTRIIDEQAGAMKLDTLKQGLMHDLLIGRVRVPQLEEVPV